MTSGSSQSSVLSDVSTIALEDSRPLEGSVFLTLGDNDPTRSGADGHEWTREFPDTHETLSDHYASNVDFNLYIGSDAHNQIVNPLTGNRKYYENINIDQDPESEYISGKIKFEEDYPSWAKGGRVSGYGGGITATMPRIPMGTPRVNAGGIRELDYRAEGGFVPVGVKEKADDVPAMLSKNEFVMTADAVKGAGGGSVEKGAQRMYNTMKKLEGRVA